MTFPAPAEAPPRVLLLALVRSTPTLLPRAVVPLTSVPMKLPSTTFALAALMLTPEEVFPEITFRAAAVVPPTVLLLALLARETPVPLAIAALPAGFVPMRFPSTWLLLVL